MDYNDLIKQFKKSDNPLVIKMINNSQEVVNLWQNLQKMSNMNEKERLDYILRCSILQISYTHKNGDVKTYRCTSNPYFIALLSIKKFTEYETVSNNLKKELSCHRIGHFATWDLIENRRVEFVAKRTRINPFNAIGLSISENSKELINETFKHFKPNKNKDKDEKESDLKELFSV